MLNTKIFILLITFALTTVASPSPWHRHHRPHHHHRNKHAPPTSKPHSSASSSLMSSATASDTVFPTLPVSSALGLDLPAASGIPGSATSSRSKCSNRTSSGTFIGTASRGSFSAGPTGNPNGTTLLASSGLAPKSTNLPSGTGKPSASTSAETPSRTFASVGPTSLSNGTTLLAPSTRAPKSTYTSSAAADTPSTTASTVTPSETSAPGKPYTGFLRGINIGGWLLLDSSLDSKLLNAAEAANQWAFDSSSGTTTKLESHWASYFQEADVKLLKSYGLNALKIPIGYWAYDNSGTPYHKGADAYLEKAIGWASKAGMKVWIDVSTIGNIPEISRDRALAHSLAILETLATKYGSAKYANTVTGLQIFPCPIAMPNQGGSAHEDFTKQAFDTIRAAAENSGLQVIMPDAAASPEDWAPLASSLSPIKGIFSVAESMSELSCKCEQAMTQAQHIEAACQRGYSMAGVNDLSISVYAGEFSPATNATMDVEGWTDEVVADVRKYVEAQLQVFETYTSGYFFWSWADEGEDVESMGWGFKAGVEKGYIPVPLDDKSKRKHLHLCDG